MNKANILKAINTSFSKEMKTQEEVAKLRTSVIESFQKKGSSFEEMVSSIISSIPEWPKKSKKPIPMGSIHLEATRNEEVAEWKAGNSFKAVNAFKQWSYQRYDKHLAPKEATKKALKKANELKTEEQLEDMSLKEMKRQAKSLDLQEFGFNHKARKRSDLQETFLIAQERRAEELGNKKAPKHERFITTVKKLQTKIPVKGFTKEQRTMIVAKFTDLIQLMEDVDYGE